MNISLTTTVSNGLILFRIYELIFSDAMKSACFEISWCVVIWLIVLLFK